MAIGAGAPIDSTLEKYKIDSNEALNIKLVHNEEDAVNEETTFHSEMSHQVFGDGEAIFGYKDLKVKLYYHAGSLLTYMSMSFDSKIPEKFGISPDPVLPKIAEIIPEGFVSNFDEFTKRLPEENKFTPMGSKVHSYTRENEVGVEYEVYHCDIFTPRLKEYHERLQTFIMWYIDAASFIDADDEKWNFFLLFKKKKGPMEPQYSIMGYMTVYHYFSYPDKIRPRISQMLILPPYQKKGHGVQLLDTITNFYMAKTEAVDISVEDPSEDFVRCRDYVDCKNCIKLDEFSKEHLLQGFTSKMTTAALKKYKINKHQARRIYEILRLYYTDRNNETMFREYRLDVKNRLNIPYQKQARDMKKLEKALSAEEYNAAIVGSSRDERMQRLEDAFKSLCEDEYARVIKRLNTYC